ncbi:sulfotransferase domain-containing protein [Zhongshania borealis]|uniref:Sulfotransferase domain-containing protein n=1 Tax=Zhongshania borealis TaxID=889488 RepID=A0ABP7WL99_9GAMM
MKNISFCVVGAQKAGTTSVHEALIRVPNISLPWNKESNYFFSEVGMSAADYLSKFHAENSQRADVFFGEVNPEYCTSLVALENLKAMNSSIKIIFIMRDPFSRACSQYDMNVRRGRECRPFEQAITESVGEKELIKHFNYIERSDYLAIVENLVHVFPRENILFLNYSDMESSPQVFLNKMLDFIGCDSYVGEDAGISRHNVNARPIFPLVEWLISKESLIKKILRIPFRLVFRGPSVRHKILTFFEVVNHREVERVRSCSDREAFDSVLMLDAASLKEMTGVDIA